MLSRFFLMAFAVGLFRRPDSVDPPSPYGLRRDKSRPSSPEMTVVVILEGRVPPRPGPEKAKGEDHGILLTGRILG